MGLGTTLMPGYSGFKKVGVVIRLEEWFLLESIIAFLVPTAYQYFCSSFYGFVTAVTHLCHVSPLTRVPDPSGPPPSRFCGNEEARIFRSRR